jgi:hypothetical protein
MPKIFKVKHLLAALVMAAAALAAATSALGFTGPPLVNQESAPRSTSIQRPGAVRSRGRLSTRSWSTTWWTRAETSSTTSAPLGSLRQRRPARQSSLRHRPWQSRRDPIDNGNGTISFVTAINGLALKFQALDGPVLKAADGQPLRSAGVLVFEDVFEAATGDYITTNVSFEGPHLGAEGVDICGPSVAYLLDP